MTFGPRALSLLLVAVALAGCSDSGGDGGTDDAQEQVFDDLDVEATSNTGVIRGVVVDPAIRPIPGVTITVPLPGGADPLVSETNPEGAFAFAGLEPGTYFIKAEKLGWGSAQQSTTVVAGVDKPDVVKILLEEEPGTAPRVDFEKHTAFIECSLRVGTGPAGAHIGLNACNDVGNQATNFVTVLEQPPTLIQGELQWSNTQTLGSGLSLVVGPPDCADIKWGRSDGPSPRTLGLNQTTVQANMAEDDASVCWRIFNYLADESAGFFGLTAQQEAELFIHHFYNWLPPEGWTYLNDGTPVPPS
ncbi:MAG: carboxypeptidase-like regulatory domain-containing protein [Thermoplasmatota archaeon]